MLSLKEMKEFGVHQLCADLCKNIINSQYPDGSELKLLLPIKYVLSDWSLRGSVDWKNPMTGEEFVLPYFWEHQRVANIDIINKIIKELNVQNVVYIDEFILKENFEFYAISETNWQDLKKIEKKFNDYVLSKESKVNANFVIGETNMNILFEAKNFNHFTKFYNK